MAEAPPAYVIGETDVSAFAMDKMSKAELVSTISKQSEQLKRYESRLRDVVTAYKGVMREKEALESSFAAIKDAEKPTNPDDSLATLTQSVATLAAEKARMEEAYQHDRKIVREQNEKKIQELQEQLQNISKQRQSEIENIKAKLAFERQEREREQTEHNLMLKEFQMKLTSERKSKEKLEDKIAISNDPTTKDLEKKLRDLNNELEATQRKLNRAEARSVETPQMLVQLQEEIAQMKHTHVFALREEKIKAKKAEEMARKVCASQEERVAALEARLAELSDTVGEYDRQRRKDQEVIQNLKDNVTFRADENKASEVSTHPTTVMKQISTEPSPDTSNMVHLKEIIEKIHQLKTELITVNGNMGGPIDMRSIFNMTDSNAQNIHSACQEEIIALKSKCKLYKTQIDQSGTMKSDNDKKLRQQENEQLKDHIKTLQDKIEILNQQFEESEKEFEKKFARVNEKFNNERASHKEVVAEQKNQMHSLEQQLQTQRERYSTLLSERENEIKSRQEKENENPHERQMKYDITVPLQEISAPPHMLHYAHELARKDLEISGLRREKHLLEGQLRDSQRAIAIEKDRFKEVRKHMKEEIDRLRRAQSREGANLEYLKNVVMSYILTTDPLSKKHMLNAIAAVLHFTDAERESVYKVS